MLSRLKGLTQHPDFARFVRFAIVGTVTALVYLALLWLGIAVLALSTLASSVIAFGLAIAFNYVFHKSWTFANSETHLETGPRYIATILGGLAINSTILHFGTDVWNLGLWGPQFVAIAVMVIYNYLIFSLLVFKTAR